MRRRARPLVLTAALVGCGGPVPDDGGDGPTLVTDVEAAAAALEAPRHALVGEPVTVDGTASTGRSVTMTLDDGRTETFDDPVDATWTLSFPEPGHHLISVETTDEAGGRDVVQRPLTVHHPTLETVPRSASTLAVGPEAVWALDAESGVVGIVSKGPGEEQVDRYAPCPRPVALATHAAPDTPTRLAVACDPTAESPPALHHVDGVNEQGLPAGEHTEAALPLGIRPRGLVYDPDGETVWVVARDRGAIDAPDGRLLGWRAEGGVVVDVAVGHDLAGLTVGGGEVIVSRFRSPDGVGRLWRLDRDDLLAGGDGTPTEIVLAPAPGPDSDTNARGVPNYLRALALRPDGRTLAVGGVRSNVLRGLVTDGQPLTDESTVRTSLRQVALHADELQRGPARLDDRDLVGALAYSPRGDWLVVAHHGARIVEVLDPWRWQLRSAWPGMPHGVTGLAVEEDGTVWVHGAIDQTIRRLQLSDDGGLTDGPSVRYLADDPDDPVRAGRRVFHDSSDRRMTLDGYVSCGSCHLDGEDDGLTWDFTDRGEGLRNTIDLTTVAAREGLPIHWSGNFDELQDFEHDIRGPQAGEGFVDDATFDASGPPIGVPLAGASEALDDLAAWLTRERPTEPDPPFPLDAEVAARGADLHADRCAACHEDDGWEAPGEPILYDVGTLTAESGGRLGGPLVGLRAPRLDGLWRSAPYLHDGRAPSLRDVLTIHDPEGLHADVADLSPADLDALILYLWTR